MIKLPELVEIISKIKDSVLVNNLAERFKVKVVDKPDSKELFYLINKTIYVNVAAEPKRVVIYADEVTDKLMKLLAEINLDYLATSTEVTEDEKSDYAEALYSLGYLTINLVLTENQQKIMRNLKYELENPFSYLTKDEEDALRRALFNSFEHNFTNEELELITINFNSNRTTKAVEMFREEDETYTIEMNITNNNFTDDCELTAEDAADLVEVPFTLIQETVKIRYMMTEGKDSFDIELSEAIDKYLAPDENSVVTDESIELLSKYSKRAVAQIK